MSLLIETIRIVNGRVMNIRWHNTRFNDSRLHLFGIRKKENLRRYIHVPAAYRSGIVKCRITYDCQVQQIEYEYYHTKIIRTLKTVHSDINYVFKQKDRSEINHLYSLKQACDDILIIKDGCVTDTSYANVAFYKNGKWLTPEYPLLNGTRRMNLINKEKIIPSTIRLSTISNYKSACIFNAMIPFGEIIIPVHRISVE